MSDDAWDIFAELCATVCENNNVYLEVIVIDDVVQMKLMPIEEEL